jgi:hypothetical protein
LDIFPFSWGCSLLAPFGSFGYPLPCLLPLGGYFHWALGCVLFAFLFLGPETDFKLLQLSLPRANVKMRIPHILTAVLHA